MIPANDLGRPYRPTEAPLEPPAENVIGQVPGDTISDQAEGLSIDSNQCRETGLDLGLASNVPHD